MATPTLALDLATRLGFALGSVIDGVCEHGSFELPKTGNDIGAFLVAYRTWLVRMVQNVNPGHIIFEAPVLPRNTTLRTVRKLTGLANFTEVIARDHSIRCTEANLSDIRMHFVGVARAPASVPREHRRQWIKEAVERECYRLGIKTVDDNAADAIALLSFECASRVKGFRFKPVQEAA